MNQALQITVPVSASTPHGRIPFLRYDPQNITKKQPLILYYHGAARRSLTQDTTTVRGIENSTEGILYYTRGLPQSPHPVTNGIFPSFEDEFGEEFEFYMLAPQLYGTPGDSTELWNNQYFTRMLDYAEDPDNGMNVDMSRVYLVGYSLGAGGVITALTSASIHPRIAAAACVAPGYAHGSATNHKEIARSGVPIWHCHSGNDNVAPVSVSDTIIRNIREEHPMFDPRYERWNDGQHNVQFRLFDITEGALYSQTNSSSTSSTALPAISEQFRHSPGLYKWFLKWRRRDESLPFYPY